MVKAGNVLERDLQSLLEAGEDSQTQFKRDVGSHDQLAVEIAAFANSGGGELLIGVDDSGGIAGLSAERVRELNQAVSNAASAKVEPPLSVETKVELVEGKRVLRVGVPLGPSKPYAVNKTEFWVKNGADKRRATREELYRLFQASQRLYADEMGTPCGAEDINWLFFSDYYRQAYGEDVEASGLSQAKLLENLKLMDGGRLTLAGLLLFGKSPELRRPQFGIKATCKGEGDRFLDKRDIGGNLFSQHEAALRFVMDNVRRTQLGDDFNAPGMPPFPERAVAELLANALAHRDYFIDAPISVWLEADTLAVTSPGVLPNTLNVENIKLGIHVERNPVVLSFLSKWPGFAYTGRGSGIPRALRLCKEHGVSLEFINDIGRNCFTAKIFPPRGAI